MIIYHTNDMHGSRAALSYLAGLSLEPQSLLLDSGDALLGSNTVFRRREPNLTMMSQLGYTAMAMGNREFNYWRRVQRWRSQERSFPLLCANLEDLRSFTTYFSPYLELKLSPERCGLEPGRRDLRLALIGATPVQYPVGSPYEKIFGFRFLNPLHVLEQYGQLLAERNDLLIVLSHLGLEEDKKLAPLLPDGTLILGGHTHTRLSQPLAVGKAFIFQTGSHGHHIGKITLEVKPCQDKYQAMLSSFRLLNTDVTNNIVNE